MKIAALLPIVASAYTLSNGGHVEQMRETFKALAQQMEGKKIDDTTKNIVNQMLQTISDTLVPALKADKTSAQNLLQGAVDDVDQCRTDRTNAFSGTVAGLEQTKNSAGTTHSTCRDGVALLQAKDPGHEGHDYGYNISRHWSGDNHTSDYHSPAHSSVVAATTSETDAYDKMVQECTALDNLVKTFDVRQQHAACMDSDNVETWFNFMSSFEQNNAAEYKTKREDCHEARHNHQHRVDQCNDDQKDYEDDYCSWCQEIDSTCETYQSCYSTEHGEYVTTNSSVADLEVIFKAQQAALECLLCYGQEILANSTDLSKCEAEEPPCVGCPDLDINYVTPHNEISCSEECPHRPCTAEYLAQEYSQWDNSNTPVAACTPCAP